MNDNVSSRVVTAERDKGTIPLTLLVIVPSDF